MIGGERRQYLTSLFDPHRYPAREIAAHYMRRWEIELGFREIKQGMQKNATTLRSKLPALVRQEVLGTLIAYNLLRHEIAQMAGELHVPPQRLSFQWLALAITMALYHWPLRTPGPSPSAWRDYANRCVPISCRNDEYAWHYPPCGFLLHGFFQSAVAQCT